MKAMENKENHYSNEDFDYNDENDTWICPQGRRAGELWGKNTGRETYYDVYWEAGGLPSMSLHEAICLTTKLDQRIGYRSVVDDGHNISRKKMKEKMALPEAQEIYKQRAIDVEPDFWTDQIQSKFYEILCARSVKSKNAVHFSLHSP